MTESLLGKRIQMAWSSLGNRLFRNNSGMGWTGSVIRVTTYTMMGMGPGDVLLKNARPFHAGLCTGSSDYIGWKIIEVTPEMVGQKVAVFCAIETKAKGGRATQEQKNFIELVNKSGGHGRIAKSLEESL